MKVLIITDNEHLYKFCKDLTTSRNIRAHYMSSSINELDKVDLKDAETIDHLIKNYSIIISLHCSQLFPRKLHESVRCINIHPGYNPYNRGYFSHVHSIINGLTSGITIHEIDDSIDGGNVIIQREIKIEDHDTSLEVYNRILEAEKELIESNIDIIISGAYSASPLTHSGNMNLKSDYTELCKLDMNNVDTLYNHIKLLRALSHGDYKNAHYVDSNGDLVYINIVLEKIKKI